MYFFMSKVKISLQVVKFPTNLITRLPFFFPPWVCADLFFFFFNLCTHDMQYHSCVWILGHAKPQNWFDPGARRYCIPLYFVKKPFLVVTKDFGRVHTYPLQQKLSCLILHVSLYYSMAVNRGWSPRIWKTKSTPLLPHVTESCWI